MSRQAALEDEPRVRIDTPSLHGSLSLVGARIDDLTLADYHETPDPSSPEIVLLSPRGAPKPLLRRLRLGGAGGHGGPRPGNPLDHRRRGG